MAQLRDKLIANFAPAALLSQLTPRSPKSQALDHTRVLRLIFGYHPVLGLARFSRVLAQMREGVWGNVLAEALGGQPPVLRLAWRNALPHSAVQVQRAEPACRACQ